MQTVAQHQTTEQYMPFLPKGQDLIRPDVPLSEWRSGPLPDLALEFIAQKIFSRELPAGEWSNPLFELERNDARGFAIQLALDFAKRDQWTLATAAEQLFEQTKHLVFGTRRLGYTIRGEVEGVCNAFISDLAVMFRDRLTLPRDIEANNREVEQEASHGRG